ncbi:outer membrane immunogenic protein [Sphingomonas sp. BE123]|jgi:outer membrane immunogenic protein|uniref:outer membrane beta-barrel protein n=1 Tax=unclassified Sphingomonas TaxID=196159 RepID=UPI002855DE38|nr:outer membrane beta-barrel protein [Sphingomonas sp. BE123]MDR6853104.1 outer membrane immunogenic protein [Sphingomonas sp. BE123]
MKKFLVAAAALACVPGVAFAQDAAPEGNRFDGLRVEARLGYETPTVSGDGDVYKIGSAMSYGGELGFDLAVSNTVTVGPFVNYEFSGVELCDGADCLDVQSNLAAGARVGVDLGGNAAIYGKLGYASLTIEASNGAVSATDSKGGVYGAIGTELSVTDKAYVNLELAYADFGDFYGTGFNLQRRQASIGFGFRF